MERESDVLLDYILKKDKKALNNTFVRLYLGKNREIAYWCREVDRKDRLVNKAIKDLESLVSDENLSKKVVRRLNDDIELLQIATIKRDFDGE